MENEATKPSSCRTQKPIVVLVAMPFHGHMTSMFQLGSMLHSKGFSIVVAHSELRTPNPSDYPEFVFQSLLDNSVAYDPSSPNLLKCLLDIHRKCEPLLEEFLVELTERQNQLGNQVSCIIYDSYLYFVDSVATRLNIPSMIFRVTAATYMKTYQCFSRLQEQNRFPFPESSLEDLVPEFHPIPMKFKDMPCRITKKIPQHMMDFFLAVSKMHSSVAYILNTSEYLEHSTLSEFGQQYRIPFFGIGPLHKMATASTTNFMEEDRSCIAFLDEQAPRSVLYVAMGSFVNINPQELIEIAWALANCGQPFLWAIRPDLLTNSKWDEHLPKDFKRVVGERGMIINWAPQKKVLAHKAIGCFWNHCGWNTTLESISEGVPMICMPIIADQFVHARMVSCLWKIGLEIENVFDRDGVGRTIRRLMVDAEGAEMRERALEMKEMLEAEVKEGGSSYESLNELVKLIASLSGRK